MSPLCLEIKKKKKERKIWSEQYSTGAGQLPYTQQTPVPIPATTDGALYNTRSEPEHHWVWPKIKNEIK